MNTINRTIAVVSFVMAVVLYLATSSQVSAIRSSPHSLGADFFPKFIAIILGAASIGLFFQSQMAINHNYETEEKPTSDWKKEMRLAVVVALLILYAVAMSSLGFVLPSWLFGIAFLGFLKVKVWWYYLIYFVSVYLIYYVFTDLLFVFLPKLGWWIL